ncbi:hypothetical protein [Pelomonas cellulosilytica]|uniref:Uncharacterized protein n=1 Tax=Pelomonas cellulosilytica TaxID=2906762 RepID=A0ABS8XY51_9BURK|nr:hypothetical protein [Pelomonas sp. P8]MCE4557569.1 hypothetical protein [Pelomonas sp. P8]
MFLARFSVVSRFAAVAALLLAGMSAQANICGSLYQAGKYGPFDYRTATAEMRDIVERNHFTDDVAELRKPIFQYFGPDLHYTLWAFPNHPRALLTLINLTLKEKTQQPMLLPFTAECYFERALRYKPDDLLVRMVYALYLKTYDRKADALVQLDYVVQKADDVPMTQYNAAKLYYELGEYEKSRAAMKTAVTLGVPYQDLIEQLRKAGHWDDEKPEDKPRDQAPEPEKEK